MRSGRGSVEVDYLRQFNQMCRMKYMFTIDVAGVPRELFSARLKPNGDVYISLRAGAHNAVSGGKMLTYSEWVALQPPGFSQIRFAVHPTRKSKLDFNAIKLKETVADGTELTAVQMTQALKRNGRFAPVVNRRSSDLRNPWYIADIHDYDIVRIGAFQPQFYTMFYSIVLTSTSTDVSNVTFHSPNVRTVSFPGFQLLLIWWFCKSPSVPGGYYQKIWTEEPESLTGDSRALNAKLMAGLDLADLNLFLHTQQEHMLGLYGNYLYQFLEFHFSLKPSLQRSDFILSPHGYDAFRIG
jgi:hypothetical protein